MEVHSSARNPTAAQRRPKFCAGFAGRRTRHPSTSRRLHEIMRLMDRELLSSAQRQIVDLASSVSGSNRRQRITSRSLPDISGEDVAALLERDDSWVEAGRLTAEGESTHADIPSSPGLHPTSSPSTSSTASKVRQYLPCLLRSGRHEAPARASRTRRPPAGRAGAEGNVANPQNRRRTGREHAERGRRRVRPGGAAVVGSPAPGRRSLDRDRGHGDSDSINGC